MIDLKSVDFLIGIITFFIAYLIAITGANTFRAWIAEKMGDDTAVQLGFLTANPLMHIDPFGLAVLCIFYAWGNYFGWGLHVPVNPFNITGSHRKLRLVCVYLSDVFAHFCMALMSIIILEILFDVRVLVLAQYMILGRSMSHLLLAHSYPAYSSLIIAIGFILMALAYLNVVLGVLYSIINGRDLYLVMNADSPLAYEIQRAQLSNIIIPMLLVLFFSEPLSHLAVGLIVHTGYFFAHVIGIA